MRSNTLPPGLALGIGRAIKRVRKARGLMQETLGSMVGVSVQTVSYWENGRSCICLGNLCRVGEALQVEPWRLLKMGEMMRSQGALDMKEAA